MGCDYSSEDKNINWWTLPKDSKERKAGKRKAARDRKRAFLKAYKESKGCDDCGSKANLTFDHIPGRGKKADWAHRSIVNTAARQSWAKVLEELQKCEVVCEKCHEARERKRGR